MASQWQILSAEQNIIDDGFQILLSAGAGQCGCAHGFCVGNQFFQRSFAGADLGADTGVVRGILVIYSHRCPYTEYSFPNPPQSWHVRHCEHGLLRLH